jgi:hypothetical protein
MKRAILLMAPFVLLSCEKPNEGLGFDQIIGDVPGAARAEYGIKTKTHNLDSILVAINYNAQVLLTTGYGAPKLIGTYVDPRFGLAKAEFVSEMILEDLNPNFGETAIVDSVNLYLRTTGYYGDTLRPMHWEVHTLANPLSRDTAYYSSFNPALNVKLGELSNFYPTPNSNFRFEGTKVSPSLKIPLNTAFFQQEFANRGDNFESFSTNELFRAYFSGIKVQVDAGEGSILTIASDNANSKILIFYRLSDTSTSTESVELNFRQDKTTKPIGFSTFEQDYTNYTVDFDLTAEDTEAMYVQSMGGVCGVLNFTDLDTLLNKGYVINRAYLELPIERGTTGGYSAASRIEVRRFEDGIPSSLTNDFAFGAGGGQLLAGQLRDNKYQIEFTREIFEVLNSMENNQEIPTFAVVPVNKSTASGRTVLKGGKSVVDTPKLVVFYTKP